MTQPEAVFNSGRLDRLFQAHFIEAVPLSEVQTIAEKGVSSRHEFFGPHDVHLHQKFRIDPMTIRDENVPRILNKLGGLNGKYDP